MKIENIKNVKGFTSKKRAKMWVKKGTNSVKSQ